MKNIGIFYGSKTGTTESIARKLAKILNVNDEDVHNVEKIAPSKVGDYDNLVLGISTWGNGEMPGFWDDFSAGLSQIALPGVKIAIFGCGDETMKRSFNNAVGILYYRLQQTGADFVGTYDADGYDFEESKAKVDDNYVGLLLDEVNHPEMTDFRLRSWAGQIIDSFKN